MRAFVGVTQTKPVSDDDSGFAVEISLPMT